MGDVGALKGDTGLLVVAAGAAFPAAAGAS
jgi:hypothetical protein